MVVEGKVMGDEGGVYLDIFNIFGGLLFKIYNDEMVLNGKIKELFWFGGVVVSMVVCFSMFRLCWILFWYMVLILWSLFFWLDKVVS